MENKLTLLRDRLISEEKKDKEDKKTTGRSKVIKSTSYETTGKSSSLKYSVNYEELADELNSKKAGGKNNWTKVQARQVFTVCRKAAGLSDPKKDK